jgi:hypothetical protein
VFTSIGKNVMHDDDRGLDRPVEAEPQHHDRRDADDRQSRDEIADRQQPARRKAKRSARMAVMNPAPQPMMYPATTALKMVCVTSAHKVGSEFMMRMPMAEGGGSRMKGTPAPRVTASQMIRIQAPKMAGMARRSSQLPALLFGLRDDNALTQRHASSQPAASRMKNGASAVPSKPPIPEIRSHAAQCAATKSRAASTMGGTRSIEIAAPAISTIWMTPRVPT